MTTAALQIEYRDRFAIVVVLASQTKAQAEVEGERAFFTGDMAGVQLRATFAPNDLGDVCDRTPVAVALVAAIDQQLSTGTRAQ